MVDPFTISTAPCSLDHDHDDSWHCEDGVIRLDVIQRDVRALIEAFALLAASTPKELTDE